MATGAAAPGEAARPGHIAGLDGLRGLAVAAVVVYHLWPGVLPAGFLGVTLFFALSGFLITTLLLDEVDRAGRVSLRDFWGRRLRRLMPMSWLVLTAVLAVWAIAGWLTEAVRRDVLWSALHVANWGRIAEAQAYGVSPEASPVLHFWSLSIEEQWYLLLPLLVAWSAPRQSTGKVLGVTFLCSTAAVWWSWDDPVRSYFSTFTRAGELVVGALAAVVVRSIRRAATGRTGKSARTRRTAVEVVATAGCALLAAAMVATSLEAPSYSRGGLLVAGVVAAVTVAATASSVSVARLLDIRPLAWLGSVSYAVYLVHWPLHVGLRRAGFDPTLAPWLTVALTLPIAAASGRFVEQPIRSRRRLGRGSGFVALMALGSLVVATAAVPDTSTAVTFDADRAVALAEQRRPGQTSGSTLPAADPTGSPGPTATPTAAAPPPIRYAWVSDSSGLPLVLGIRSPEGFEVAGWWTQMGCPAGRGGRVRSASTGTAVWTTAEKGCAWDESLAAAVPAGDVDVALASFGRWDVAEREVPELGGGWTTLDDPRYDTWLFDELSALTGQLHGAGVHTVVWLTLPYDDPHAPRDRVDRFNGLLRRLETTSTTGRVAVLDLAGWLEATGERRRLLPDGVHATFEPDGGTADEIGRRFLFPELTRLLGG